MGPRGKRWPPFRLPRWTGSARRTLGPRPTGTRGRTAPGSLVGRGGVRCCLMMNLNIVRLCRARPVVTQIKVWTSFGTLICLKTELYSVQCRKNAQINNAALLKGPV